MKFKTFIAESASVDLHELAVSIADSMATIHVPKMYNPAAARAFIEAVDEVQAGVEAGQIYNAALNDAKSTISYQFEKLYNALYYRKIPDDYDGNREHNFNPNMHRWILDNYDVSPNVNLTNYKSQMRLIEKSLAKLEGHDKAHASEMLGLLEKFGPIVDAIKSLKDKTIKGRKPAEPDPNAFHNVVGSKASQDLVKKHLLSNITPSLDKFEQEMTKYLEDQLEDLAGRNMISEGSIDGLDLMIIQHCLKYEIEYEKGPAGRKRIYVLKGKNTEAAAWPAAEAKKMRKAMEEGFLSKNIQKLSNIIDRKGNLSSIVDLPSKPVTVRSGRGALEAGFKLSFSDASEFSVVNKIITNYSMRGLPFYQYPTTFHDVKLPDGSKLSMPSEEKMVKEFAK